MAADDTGGIDLGPDELERPDLEARFGDAPLIRYQPHGTAQPLVLIRTWPDEVVKHAVLARALGPDQPVVSIAVEMTEDDFPRTVSEWADRCIERLQANLRPGRAVLGGWSFGGVIALELAERLERAGHEVGSVVLLDSALPRQHKPGRAGAVHESARRVVRILDKYPPGRERRLRLRQAARHAPAAWARWSRRRLRWALERLGRNSAAPPAFDRTNMDPRKRAIWTAYLKYRSPGSSLPVTILATEDSRRSSGGDLALGWHATLTGDVDLRMVGGDHYSMFDDDHVDALARRVAEVLDRHRPAMIDLTDTTQQRSVPVGR